MKKILITGAESYIGTSVETYLKKWPEKYEITTLDMRDDKWESFDFSGYDIIYHVAGIAHSDTRKVSRKTIEFYYKVNSELAIKTAKKAKEAGAKQFIFMSSAIVYGDSAPIGKSKMITKDTPLSPANFYADSKVKAEEGIRPLDNENFKVVILRPPMIYGKNSKGNYPLLRKFAVSLYAFPKVFNERSMLYVENLAEFVRLMIDNEESGTFFPQNGEYSNTSSLVAKIAKAHESHLILLPGFTPILKLLSHVTKLVDKAFGNLTYDMTMSEYKENYRIYTLDESIIRTEK